MGLDTVELVMRIEETFGVEIPDEVASRLVTPDDVADYIMTRVRVSEESLPCLTQKAFQLLRRSFTRTLHTPRRAFRPDTPLKTLLPDDSPRDAWERVGRDAGLKAWPSIFRPGWLRALTGPDCQSVRELTDYVLTNDAAGVKGPEGSWTRRQVEDVLRRVIVDETGVRDFTGSSRFVDDMGLD